MSCLMFMSLNHFEFIFVYGVRECSNFVAGMGTTSRAREWALI